MNASGLKPLAPAPVEHQAQARVTLKPASRDGAAGLDDVSAFIGRFTLGDAHATFSGSSQSPVAMRRWTDYDPGSVVVRPDDSQPHWTVQVQFTSLNWRARALTRLVRIKVLVSNQPIDVLTNSASPTTSTVINATA